MQSYMDAPLVEVHEDQHIDHTLAQLKQDLTQQLQHQLSGPQQVLHEAAGSGHQSLSASMHVAADTNTAPDTAAASTELQQPEQQPADASFEAAAAAVDEPVMAEAPEQQAAAAAEPAAASPAGPTSESSEKLSCEDESEWQLVSPHGSVRLPGSTGRDSFEYAGVAGATLEVASASSCSGSDTTSSPKDELAESILGNSVLMAAGAAAASGSSRLAGHIAAAAELHTGSDDGMEAVREASLVSAEGGLEGLLGSSQAAAAVAAATEDGAAVVLASPQVEANSTLAAAAGQEQQAVQGIPETEVLTGLGLLRGEIAHLVGAAQGKAVLSLQGLREWLLESLAALVQSGRVSHAACVNTKESIQRSMHLMAKQGGLAAAAVSAAADWRVVLSSAAAVVCLAMWLRSRNEAAVLRAALRRRDHELSKLVMRLVSLQELLNQGQALPITRYMRYEGAPSAAAAASYM